jgi:hypothetical protein
MGNTEKKKLINIVSDLLLRKSFKYFLKLTDMAQRQRAGLITQRTQDRNLLSVSSHYEDNNLVITIKNRHGAAASARGS